MKMAYDNDIISTVTNQFASEEVSIKFEYKPIRFQGLCDLRYKENDDLYSFYSKFRSVVCDNLRKKGDKIKYLEDQEDEIISPTFEDVIILWCLEKINTNLPNEVIQLYGHLLIGNVTLKDFEKEIFNHVPVILPETKLQTEIKELPKEDNSILFTKEEGALDLDSDLDNNKIDASDYIESHPTIGTCSEELIRKQKLLDYEVLLSDNEYACKICDKNFDTRMKLLSHRVKHRPQEVGEFSCDNCDKIFDTKRALIKHKSCVHKRSYKCENCPIELPNNRKYQIHLKEHEGFKCDDCGKEHANYKALYKHKQKHTEKLKCSHCDLFFSDQQNLSRHLEKHTGTNKTKKLQKCVCPECGLTIVSQSNLNRHRKSCHTPQVKHLPCEFCGKLFANTWNLRSHLTVHKSDKATRDFQCSTCARSFYTEDKRASHVCKHYSCETCNMKFVRERNLKLHKRTHSGETIFSCPQCEALFEKKKQLNSHKNITHNERRKYACGECTKAFKTSSGLKQHTYWHRGEKPFKCELCDMSFITKAHLQSHSLTHNNEYPFECESCDSRFRDVGQLKKHREKQMCGVTSLDLYKTRENKI